MNWNAFNPHHLSYESAFEAFCIQLFEHYLRRTYAEDLKAFFALSGSGGDGGVEAYGALASGCTLGLQAKWFRTALNPGQIGQIKSSILTALKNRPEITEYIICLPKKVNSKRIVRGGKTSGNSEQQKLADMVAAVKSVHMGLTVTWWFENDLLDQLQFPDCKYVESYWFGQQFISLEKLRSRFTDQTRHSWLKSRYVPDINTQGVIADQYDELCLDTDFREAFRTKLARLSSLLTNATGLIELYLTTLEPEEDLHLQLLNILTSFREYDFNITRLQAAITNPFPKLQLTYGPEYYIWTAKLVLDHNRPTNMQRPLRRPLSRALEEIHQIHVSQYLKALSDHLATSIKVIFGGPGTGKTQGLAFSVSCHLAKGLPALIIPAKGTPNRSWTEVLCTALEYPGRNAEEILTAIEALALTDLHSRAAAGANPMERSVALICVDGLEEDVSQWAHWYDRINDCATLVTKFPRLRFLFAARSYFRDHEQLLETVPFAQVELRSDGDVPVWEAAETYFSPQHFNIRHVSDTVMSRIESLYALKLFCELYAGQDLAERTDVYTDLRSLLNRKTSALDDEFKKKSSRPFSTHATPVTDIMVNLAAQFYQENDLERNSLLSILSSATPGMTYPELEAMLDFLTDHGVLTAGYHPLEDGIRDFEIRYYVPYQSITEHMLSEDIYRRIVAGKIDHIPGIVINGMVASRQPEFIDPEAVFPNETMAEAILKRIFLQTGRLVGVDGYLSHGLQEQALPGYQMAVLAVARTQQAQPYEPLVRGWLRNGRWHQQQLYLRMIRPATKLKAHFGAWWLHEQLLAIPTVYERDQFLWADRATRKRDSITGLEAAIYPFSGYDTSLYPFDTYDQEPLIYAWCLSSPNRNFRRELRSSLLNWANLNIWEWIKLVGLMLEQDDTQILEDLASVALGLAHRLEDAGAVRQLAVWAVEAIFDHSDWFYSSRFREGFRAIVNKAYDMGLISEAVYGRAKPLPGGKLVMIPVDREALQHAGEQYFPIVSDLAWYVIGNAYEPFFAESYDREEYADVEEETMVPGTQFLQAYAERASLSRLSAHTWAVAAGAAFIAEKFGFRERSGRLSSLPSHGEKGEIMYFAEKYVWQSVYFLQGYLSEQLPLAEHGHYVDTYTQLTSLANPSEGIMHNGDLLNDFHEFKAPEWVIPEDLVHTIRKVEDLSVAIRREIEVEPRLNLPSWLYYQDGQQRKFTLLYNETMLEDRNGAVYGRLTANAVLIEPLQLEEVLSAIRQTPEEVYFLSALDGLYAHTTGAFYHNPSDVVASNQQGENNSSTLLYLGDEECRLYHSILKGTKSELNTEIRYCLPSKLLRNVAGITQLKGKKLKDASGETIGFVSNMEDRETKDEQQLTCVLSGRLEPMLTAAGYQLLWFFEVFKRTTLATEKAGVFLRRTRKYAVWREGTGFKTLKFWDKESSN